MSRTHRILVAAPVLALGALLGPSARAEDGEESQAGAKFETAVATAKALEASFAHVEFVLRYDDGDAPERIGSGAYGGNYGGYVTEERPLEMVGIVLAPDRVVTADPRLHPRFVTSVTVVFRGERVPATPFAYPA